MNFEQLLYTDVLAHSSSLNQAAQILHISKTGLSLSITQLEKELGIKIFKRTYLGTSLTTNGQVILPKMQKILYAKNDLKNAVHKLKGDARQSIDIQYVNSYLENDIIQAAFALKKRHSRLDLELSRHHPATIINNVLNKEISAGLIAINQLDNHPFLQHLSITSIADSNLKLIINPQSRLATKKEITGNDLRKQNFCLFDDPFNIEIFNRLQSICGPLHLGIKTDSERLILKAVAQFQMIGLGRYIFHQPQPYYHHFCVRSLNGLIPDRFSFICITNPDNNDKLAFVNDFIQALKKYISTIK